MEHSLQSSSITGAAEYKSNGIAPSSNNHDVPCAVCFSTAPTSHMFPAKATCPDGCTEQYQGYLISSHCGHSNTCVWMRLLREKKKKLYLHGRAMM